jgi:hypothetical protein
MYLVLWRVLPGPLWLRILFALLLAIGALYVLATWVFPWVDTLVNNQEATVDGP